MTTGIIRDQNLEKQIEKQMGCMAGFLQIFDRHQLLTGKRLYSTKRLPSPSSSPAVDSESEMAVESPSISTQLEKEKPHHVRSVPSPDRSMQSPLSEFETPAESPAKMPLPLPVFGFKEGTKSSWKFRESPRLSLDSRATVDAKGSLYPREIRTNAAILSGRVSVDTSSSSERQRRSPSVIARLMGLEQLPHSSCPEPMKKAELRRSASESRSRDLLQYRSFDGGNQFNSGTDFVTNNVIRGNARNEEYKSNVRSVDPMEYSTRIAKSEPPPKGGRGLNASSSPWKSPQQRKSFYDSADFFPEPKQTVSIYGEIERRLKMRGIDEPSKDLETLKQILEALQLKGLLHSKKSREQINYRNIVYDRNFSHDESPIVLMKPSRSPIRQGRTSNDSPPSTFRSRPGPRRNINHTGEVLPASSPRREIDRNARNNSRVRNSSSPSRSESSVTSTNSPMRRKPLNIEIQRRGGNNDSMENNRRVSPAHSPKLNSKRTSSSDQARSPINRKPTAEMHPKASSSSSYMLAEDEHEHESSSISESSFSTSSHTDTERRTKMEEYKEGRTLLDRCDKLLHSIAEMTSSELQPSPVSVLDSSFYKDDSSSPSPVMKRSIDFKDQQVDLEDEIWSPVISPIQSKQEEISGNCDYIYISEILRAFNYLPEEESDIFLWLEKHQYLKGSDTSKVSTLERKLIFDTITEILNRNRQLPPWKTISMTNSGIGMPSLHQIWSEFEKIRERDESDDLFEVIFGVLKKDLAGDSINGWGECHVETSEAVLDIERLIFKDLVGETIRDLAALAGKSRVSLPHRRKLVF